MTVHTSRLFEMTHFEHFCVVVYWSGVWPAATIASFEERLILLVCSFPCLYDVENCSLYKDVEKKRNAWEYIAKHIDASISTPGMG